jgi:hypothetical protein
VTRPAAASLLVLALLVSLFQSSAAPVASAGVTATRSPYLVQMRRTQATIAWKTNISSTTVVHYGLTPSLGLVATGASGTFHSVTLTNLTPDTRYYYRAQSNGTYLNNARPFRPLARVTTPTFRFAVVGDFGDGSADEVAVEDEMVDRSPRLVMTTGDNVYTSGTEANLDAKLFPQYADLLDNIGMNAALGNHDVSAADNGVAVKQSLKIPSVGYYSFDTSSAHFVVLDSNNRCFDPTCPQMVWLTSDLAATSQQFTFVFFHHTVSSCGNHGNDEEVRAAWHPIFAAAGVDIVFMGHDHGYQRSVPIDGVTYITTGGGGAELYTWVTPCPEAAVFAGANTSPDAHHMLIVDLASGQATVRAINRDGLTLDSAVVTP